MSENNNMPNDSLEVHIPLGEIAGGEVEVQAIERHDPREQHALHGALQVFEVVAVHEDACWKPDFL